MKSSYRRRYTPWGKLSIFRHDSALTLGSSQVQDWFHERQEEVRCLLFHSHQPISSPLKLQTKRDCHLADVAERILQNRSLSFVFGLKNLPSQKNVENVMQLLSKVMLKHSDVQKVTLYVKIKWLNSSDIHRCLYMQLTSVGSTFYHCVV